MPIVPAGDLTTLRTTPQTSRMYLVVQQPERYDTDAGTFNTADFLWYGRVTAAPASDPVTSLAITAHADSPTGDLQDRMTVLISSSGYGFWDRAFCCLHGDQTVVGAGAAETLYLAVSSELQNVEVDDYVVVLDEFRFWTRMPKITESGGTLSWYKDYGFFRDSIGTVDPDDLGYTWTQLGGAVANRRQASMPAVPIMGPHVVEFIDPDVGSVDVDFDWSDSYAVYTGAAVNAWTSWGEDDHVGGTWNDNVQNPAAKTYSTISGLRGFRTVLELGTDQTDPIVEFVRGVRYVFTLRRPEDLQDSDPADAAPITDFQVDSIMGSFDQGGWSASLRILGTQADRYVIVPGALVILFAEDRYGGTEDSIGPNSITLVGRENIVMVGYIADGTISQDSETGDVTFDVMSVSGLMMNRENYPVPIENSPAAVEWYEADDLTIDRAAHHYITWHTDLKLIADFYQTGDTREIAAMDFLAGDCYSTIDQFIQDRLFARLLCDRFGRFSMEIDQQLETAGGAATLFTLQDSDWVGEVSVEEIVELPTSVADAGGIYYNGGLAIPYLSHAPGEMSGYEGTPEQRMALALSGQAQLNTLTGRLYGYLNNPWPRLTLTYAGNWRVFDIWPQEYVAMDIDTDRVSFAATDLFIVREVQFDYDPVIGAIMATVGHEYETDDMGISGVTVEIPGELPDFPTPLPPSPPYTPPSIGVGGGVQACEGRKMISTDVGVFVTDDIKVASPRWYAANTGWSTAEDLTVWDIKRDPFHWWTSGGTERTLWALCESGIWKMENFPYGTWSQILTAAAIRAFVGVNVSGPLYGRLDFSIETEGRFAFAAKYNQTGSAGACYDCVTVQDEVMQFAAGKDCGAVGGGLWSDVKFGQHSGGQWLLWSHSYSGGSGLVRLRRTTDFGDNWTQVQAQDFTFATRGSISWPYVGAANPDSYAFWNCALTVIYTSIDGGINWTQNHWGKDRFGTGGNQNRLFLGDDDQCSWSNDGGATWTDLPDHGLVGAVLAYFVEWGPSSPLCVLAGDYGTLGLKAWQNGMSSWVDKTGNLSDFGITDIYQIQRDTMGSA